MDLHKFGKQIILPPDTNLDIAFYAILSEFLCKIRMRFMYLDPVYKIAVTLHFLEGSEMCVFNLMLKRHLNNTSEKKSGPLYLSFFKWLPETHFFLCGFN